MDNSSRVLYRELLEKIPHALLSQTLPLVYRLARDLGDTTLEKWTRLELYGYFKENPVITDDVVVPQYRFISGFHADIYGRPLLIQDTTLEFINTYPLRSGVEELEKMTSSPTTIAIQDLDMINLIQETLKVQVYSFNFSQISVVGVLSNIKSKLTDILYNVQQAHPDILDEGEKTTISQGREHQVYINIGDGTTISGDIVIASSIQNSFIKANTSSVSGELKELLKQLAQEVGKMSQNLPKETAEEVARDLETLIAEATSKTPRKKWWQLSTEGLKQAAKNVGAIGEPVLKLVAMIVALLAKKN